MNRSLTFRILRIGLYLVIGFIALILIQNDLWIRIQRSRVSNYGPAGTPDLQVLNTAEVTYQATYPGRGFTCILAELGPPPAGQKENEHFAGLIDKQFANGIKNYNRFAPIKPCKKINGITVDYNWGASPIENGVKGRLFYCTDQTGVIKAHLKSAEKCLAEGQPLKFF